MAKAIKKEKNITTPNKLQLPQAEQDNVRAGLAIGTITLLISILLLYILNYIIYTCYTPNIQAILDKVVPQTFVTAACFLPEPVERMQYQLSLLLSPVFIFLVYTFVNRSGDFFQKNSSTAYFINIAGIVLFTLYLLNLLNQSLLYVADPDNPGSAATTQFFFKLCMGSKYYFMVVVYCLFAYLFIIYKNSQQTVFRKAVINIVLLQHCCPCHCRHIFL